MVPMSVGTKAIELHPSAEYDSKGTRLTCVALADGEDLCPPSSGKRKWNEDDDDSSDRGDDHDTWDHARDKSEEDEDEDEDDSAEDSD